MILNDAPRLKQMVVEVWRPLLVLFVWDCAVTALYLASSFPFNAPALPLTIFGTVLALFLGFRDNSAYQRWWEGRVLWGAMINASRSLSRGALAMLPTEVARAVIRRHVAYVHALRCALRRQGACPDLDRLLPDEAEGARRYANVPNALLTRSAHDIAVACRQGSIDTIQQASLERVLVDIANAQGGMERLKNTPLPMQYRFFPMFFTRLFCVLLPIGLVETLGWATPIGSTLAGLMFLAALAIGDDLVDPFANTPHDVPLTAMCRTIEIDLLQSIGEEAPTPLQPVKGVLW